MLKKLRPLALLLAVITTVFAIASCKSEENQASSEITDGDAFPYTFIDSDGISVTVTKKPKKIAVLFSSYADIWVTAGGRVDITVGESVERGFTDNSAVLVDSGAGHSTIDMETLIASEPDIVIGTADFECQAEAVRFCRSAGIPAAAFRVESFEDYLAVLKICCDLTGNTQNYELYGTKIASEIAEIKSKVAEYAASCEIIPVLFVRAGSSARSTKAKTAADNYVCAMLDELYTQNIANKAQVLKGELSLEAILENPPDYLFITTMGNEEAAKEYMDSLLKSDGWKQLECVRTGKYAYLPKELFHFKPNSRWAESYRCLAGLLYPEIDLE